LFCGNFDINQLHEDPKQTCGKHGWRTTINAHCADFDNRLANKGMFALQPLRLAEIKAANLIAKARWRHLLKGLGGARKYGIQTPVRWEQILEICGQTDCLLMLERVDSVAARRVVRRFVLECAERVLPNYEKWAPEDKCVRDCLELTRKHFYGHPVDKYLAADAAQTVALNAKAAASYAAEHDDDPTALAAENAAEAAGYAYRVVWGESAVVWGENRPVERAAIVVPVCATQSVFFEIDGRTSEKAESKWQHARLKELLSQFEPSSQARADS
jgi:hypothetical protein